jgi:DNA-directed RNA polymerase subunit beta
MGFIETYRKVTNGVVDLVSTPIYLSAEEEEGMLISQEYSDGQFWENYCRKRNCTSRRFPVIDPVNVDYADVAPNQIASISALIPFLEHDDANSVDGI